MNPNYFYKPYVPRNLKKIPCSVCGGERESLVAPENNLRIVRCGDCGYVFVNPRPSPADLDDFYREYFPDVEGLPESWGGPMDGIYTDIHRQLSSRLAGGRILDIGSSYGHFLARFDRAAWETVGVEPSPIASAWCRQHYPGVVVHNNNFDDAELGDKGFDVVTSFYVAEHVFDPRAFMQKVHHALVDDGIAVIRIPYSKPFFSLARLLNRPMMYAPMHLNDFAPRHFERMCSDIGFASVRTTVGVPCRGSDPVERFGALVFSSLGRLFEAVTLGRVQFPYAGAYTYILSK